MTDQELVEAAAPAAGVHGTWDERLTGYGIARPNQSAPVWNPLTNDGDALRAAAHQGIGLIYYREGVRAVVDSLGKALGVPFTEVPDRAAATRRAITRALAAIHMNGA